MSLKKKLSNQISLKQKYIKEFLIKEKFYWQLKLLTLLNISHYWEKKKKTYSSYKLYVVLFKSHCPNEIIRWKQKRAEKTKRRTVGGGSSYLDGYGSSSPFQFEERGGS